MALELDRATRRRLAQVSETLAAEFDGVFSRQTVAGVVTDSLARLGDATVFQYLPVLCERFARQRLRAAAQADGLLAKTAPVLLFVCAGNAGRSQMAAALATHVSQGRVEALSAGANPAARIDLQVLDVMAEIGIALTLEFPKPLTDEVIRAADVVVTMGCGEVCPIHPGPRYLDWPIDDPAGRSLASVRRIRQDIANHVLDLLKELLA
ncbi:MAG: three-helix bundle dimerization domain-containing protein [Solirubrobacteraceae bacterium]